jgi:hypothetical protein
MITALPCPCGSRSPPKPWRKYSRSTTSWRLKCWACGFTGIVGTALGDPNMAANWNDTVREKRPAPARPLSVAAPLPIVDGRRHYWRARLVKGGPTIAVATFFDAPFVDGEIVDRAPRWQALVGTETTARAILMGDALPIEVDGATLRNLESVELAEYEFLIGHRAWAEEHQPDHYAATPRKAIDVRKLEPIW